MKLLAIETSTDLASVAVMNNGVLFDKEYLGQKNHAQFLLPTIHELMEQSSLGLNQLDAIVFGSGPGSFTGLRIACSIAKGLAYAHDLPLIAVSSLAAICWSTRQQLSQDNLSVLAVLDARMQELYWSYFSAKDYTTVAKVSAAQEINLPQVNSLVLSGLGIEQYWPYFSPALQEKISTKITVFPKAKAMLHLALQNALPMISAAEAQPIYVRNQVIQGV